MKNFSYLLALLLLPSCVHGPKQEKKSPLNVLSGEHYQADGVVEPGGIPLSFERKIKKTEISGRVQVIDPLAVIPANLTVQLWQEKKMLHEEKVDNAGGFTFLGDFPNGDYLLRTSSSRFQGELPVKVDSYKVGNLVLIAEKKRK